MLQGCKDEYMGRLPSRCYLLKREADTTALVLPILQERRQVPRGSTYCVLGTGSTAWTSDATFCPVGPTAQQTSRALAQLDAITPSFLT